MSYQPTTYTECPDVQVLLEDYYNDCDASMMRDPAPFYDYVNSEANRTAANYSQAVAPGEAKLKTVTLLYNQRIEESAVTAPGTDRTCVATTVRGNLSTSCTVDPSTYIQVDELIKNIDFRYVCQNASDLLPKKMMRMLNALMSKDATNITNAAATLLGDWGNDVPAARKVTEHGVQYLSVPTLKSGGVDVDPKGMQRIDSAMIQSQWCRAGGAPIFSDLNLWEYFRLMKAGCCADNGLSLEKILQQYGYGVVWDRRVALASGFGGNYAWTVQPGALQVVHYVENDNGVSEAAGVTAAGSNYLKRIIHDPVTGAPVDLTIKDDCGNVSIIMRKVSKLCALPYDLFPVGDHMEGVSFFAGIKVVNP